MFDPISSASTPQSKFIATLTIISAASHSVCPPR